MQSSSRPVDPDALFEEARKHRRERRLRVAFPLAVLVAAGMGAYFVDNGGAPRNGAGPQSGALAPSNRGARPTVKIYFSIRASRGQENAVAAKLKANPDVVGLTYISKTTAFDQLKKTLTKGLTYNPLPDSYVVTLSKSKYAQAVRSSFHPLPPGVNEVVLGRK